MEIIIISACVLILGFFWSQNSIWSKCSKYPLSARDFFHRNSNWIMASSPPSKPYKGPFSFSARDPFNQKKYKVKVYYIGDQNKFKEALVHLDHMLFPSYGEYE